MKTRVVSEGKRAKSMRSDLGKKCEPLEEQRDGLRALGSTLEYSLEGGGGGMDSFNSQVGSEPSRAWANVHAQPDYVRDPLGQG